MPQPALSAAARFRRLLDRPGLIRSLGVHDVFSGLIVERAGFELAFMGGFGTSASLLGLPDLNLLTMTEMADAIRRMAARLTIPIIADGDTGHGDLHNVRRTVEMFEAAGAAGILLEDQVMPKRCGHFANKQVVSRAELLARIRTAVAARRNADFAIFARTDARQQHGLEEAIARVNECCDAGADVAFVEAPQSAAELEAVACQVPHPLLANMLTGGVTPILPADELERLGYGIAVCPIESLLVCGRALQELCETWKRDGRVDHLVKQGMSFAELKGLLEVDKLLGSSV